MLMKQNVTSDVSKDLPIALVCLRQTSKLHHLVLFSQYKVAKFT